MKKHIEKWSSALLSLVLVFTMMAGLPPAASAATSYVVPAAGDVAWINTSVRATRSDTGAIYCASAGNHEIRDFRFPAAGYGGVNKNYNPDTQLYCIEYGKDLSSSPCYTAYAPNTTFWNNLSTTAQEGIMLSMGFGWPASTLAELGAASEGDAIAATQTLIWEFYTGKRTTFSGNPGDMALYNTYINGTPANGAYWKILSLANAYRSDSRYSFADLKANSKFIMWVLDGYQTIMSYSLPNESSLPTLRYEDGYIEIYKTDPNGNKLAGAYFRATNTSDSTKSYMIGPTDSSGYAIVKEPIPYGTYTVTETVFPTGYTSSGISEWTVTLDSSTPNGLVTIHAVNKLNTGNLKITKITNTGENSGWSFLIKNAAGAEIGTYATGGDGTVTVTDLTPGTYTVQEVSNGDSYWSCDTEAKTVTVTAGGTANVTVTNTHYGRIQIVKQTNTGADSGWSFVLKDAAGTEIGTYTTGDAGTVTTENLLPGTYTVQELIPEESLFYCKSQNPQTVSVTAGGTADVTFINALRPGKLSVQKVDIYGQPLAGAKFILEWSEDGINWAAVTQSDGVDVIKGGSANAGTQVSPENGIIEWNDLHPGLYYRITELEAPEGYNLLTTAAFEGQLPVDDLTVALRVVNTQTFTLPETGSHAPILLPLGMVLCLSVCAGAIVVLRKKER